MKRRGLAAAFSLLLAALAPEARAAAALDRALDQALSARALRGAQVGALVVDPRGRRACSTSGTRTRRWCPHRTRSC